MKKNVLFKILVVGIIAFSLQFCFNFRVLAADENTTGNEVETVQTENKVKEQKKSVADLKNKINTSVHVYTGEKRKPSVALYDGSKKLKEGKDYKVTYKNNKNPGKATITVKGKGNYKGTLKRYFYIAPKRAKITSVMFDPSFKKAKIQWEKDSKATGYLIYMAEKKNGTYKKIKTIKSKKVTEYTKKGLNYNKLYYFKVRAYKKIDGKIIAKKYSKAKTSKGLIAEVHLTASSSGANRNVNLKLASKKIKGTILKPGDTFNWFNVVGPASKARGFRKATVFANGKTAQGYGGGVCQVSTTLYQAAVQAKLKIVERHLHSKPVTYTKWGKDATVSYGVQNLRIKNNKKYSIKIVSYAEGGTTSCKMYRVSD